MSAIEGPVAGWLLSKLGPVGRWLRRRFVADHAAILDWKGWPDQHYFAFFAVVAVAPSRTPKPIPLVEFVDRAQDLVRDAVGDVFRVNRSTQDPN